MNTTLAPDPTPIYDELAARYVLGDPVDTEYGVLVAQAVMDLLAGRAP